jgi:hypothetical protein
MAGYEIDIDDKIHSIYANLEDIKRLLESSKTSLKKTYIYEQIQEHENENLKFVQELNGQGVTNQEIQRRLQEVLCLMRNDFSNHNARRSLPSKMKRMQTQRPWDRIIKFVPPKHEPSVEFQSPEDHPPLALLR